MIFALNYDGSYREYKTHQDLRKKIKDIQYLLIDNSTSLKGKTFTLVDASKLSIDNICNQQLLELRIEISYVNGDTPWCDETTLTSKIVLNSIEKMFSIYPFIWQLFDFNIYKNEFALVDNMININSITLKMKDGCDIEIEPETPEKIISDIFKNLGLKTSVMKSLGKNNHLILKNGKWFISKNIPSKFDKMAYNLSGTETLYLISYKQYNRFQNIKHLNIDIYDHTDYDRYGGVFSIDEQYPMESDIFNVDNNISCSGLSKILKTCVYFPQFIDLEKIIYRKMNAVKITLSTTYINYTLDITEKEASDGICLFKILNKLLQM